MLTFDERQNFSFFGASDETQAIGRTYYAICTPNLFTGFSPVLPKPQVESEFNALQGKPVSEDIRRSLSS